MTSVEAVSLVSKLVSISVLVQSFELMSLRKEFRENGLYPWSILKAEYSRGLQPLFSLFFSARNFPFLILAQLILALVLFILPVFWICVGLMITALFINLRFRGTFNGGSDKMTLMSLIALVIATSHDNSVFSVIVGMWFLALQSVTSYLFAGFAKLREPTWRSGSVLFQLLNLPHYPVPQMIRKRVMKNPEWMKIIPWALLGFECLFPLIFLNSFVAMIFFSAALIFHLMNVCIFGLNRFFFAWVATYPAIFFLIQK